ncbi:glycerol-3-phosphate dehydrogenase/oxidase [Pseudovibrio sp. Tun.PSC04-5.I4]|uniref:glycerol-3-phosphate dehydrogenase/oxidase n=1 Tax=Pseudovibrio sp. Tun.PSC04-5.I4 TaxID=1798213 RepID=UPI000890C88B|nr:glycerol-3-phosphate dehydrogenase/oxidase [Pseudovibrio sp. Tun.PSC04-5.I4]SDQ76224.1 glycerol-3-phosphate dehydrogenase [Pseudovibrio sp. Tun.PSC04-5.I4]
MAGNKEVSRQDKISGLKNRDKPWDVVVVGGGITGAGVALLAARAGLDVLLLEQRDYAWGTSSRSSKMVHGGLRYLSQGDFRLTRESVVERERMLREAPGLVEPMNYLFPFREKQFPTRRIFSILMNVYGYFAGKRDHRQLDKEQTLIALPGLREDGLLGSTQYVDALTNDSRLVLRLLAEARRSGAKTLNYIAAKSIETDRNQLKQLCVEDQETSETITITSKTVVNATGVWADKLRQQVGQAKRIRPLRGSHVVVPSWRLPVHQCLTYLHPQDKRGVFIYPWQGRTVIGTTDLDHKADLKTEAAITQQEVEYLLDGANKNFPGAKLSEDDVVATWSGIRPIVGDEKTNPEDLHPSKAKRDHVVWDDDGLITATGGKLTTFRVMAEEVLEHCSTYVDKPITTQVNAAVFRELSHKLETSQLPPDEQRRLQGYYGDDFSSVIAEMEAGEKTHIPGTYCLWAELAWAAQHEEVVHLDDLLLRRTRIGLVLEQGGAALACAIEVAVRNKLGWSTEKWDAEWLRYTQIWQDHYSLPQNRQSPHQTPELEEASAE